MSKPKEFNLTNSKKSDLVKAKKPDFAKANLFETDFLTFKDKKAFIHLQKVFTMDLILKHFDLEQYICIESNTLEYY